jgi:hypothetical protein
MATEAQPTPPVDGPPTPVEPTVDEPRERTTEERVRSFGARAKSIWCGILSGLG